MICRALKYKVTNFINGLEFGINLVIPDNYNDLIKALSDVKFKLIRCNTQKELLSYLKDKVFNNYNNKNENVDLVIEKIINEIEN
jgi:hypothetical protein